MDRTELIGREPEIAALADAWQAALDGDPRVVLCRGEPGIGKTRLAEELSRSAAAAGAVVAWGRGVDAEGAPPYWPWRQVLRGISTAVDLAEIADEHRLSADLNRIAPEIFACPAAAAGDGGSGADRFRLFDAVGRVLSAVSGRRPLLIVIDDAHLADRPSLLLLQQLARGMARERLLVVVNHRDTEPLPAVLVTELLREPVTRQVELRGLSAQAVGRQLAGLVGHQVADTDASRVHDLTGGNPFFVAELGRLLADRPAGAPVSSMTSSVRDAIAARLDRLSPQTVRLLRAAAIVGPQFSVAVVAPMVDIPVLACLAPLDQAVAAGLVTPGETPGEHQFVHALVRDAIEVGIGTAERVALHRAAALAVEEFYAGRLEPHLSDLARHWAVAAVVGDRGRAAGWIERAGREAMHRLAYEEGARLFRLALNVGAGELDEQERCRLLLGVGTALHLAADVPGRLRACLEAAELARKIDRPDLLAHAALVLEGTLHRQSDLAARQLCMEAMDALGPEPNALSARVTARFAEVSAYVSDVEAARAAGARALATADQCGEPGAEIAALTAYQVAWSGPDGIEERARLVPRVLAIGRESGDPTTQMWAHLWQIDVAFERGDLAHVAREAEALATSTAAVGGPLPRWHLLRVRAALAAAQARFPDALQLTEQARASFAAADYPFLYATMISLLMLIGHHIGHDERGSNSLAVAGLVDAPPGERGTHTPGLMDVIGQAAILVEAGRAGDAEPGYRALGPVAGWRPGALALICYAFAVPVAIALNLPGHVRALRERLLRYRGLPVGYSGQVLYYGGPVELYTGLAAAHLGLLDEAAAEFDHVMQVCAANGAAGYHAEAQLHLAGVLARRGRSGDLPRARALVTDGAAQAIALGMTPWVAQADRIARLLNMNLRPGAPLTAREREVAELVANGLTNREIAAQLYLSERTAQNHVQHILTKLSLPNRSQIAVWVTSQN